MIDFRPKIKLACDDYAAKKALEEAQKSIDDAPPVVWVPKRSADLRAQDSRDLGRIEGGLVGGLITALGYASFDLMCRGLWPDFVAWVVGVWS